MSKQDVIIIGASAAGLMCAIEAGKRGRKVLVLDHSNKPGKKILMSGGGRCNFTNYQVEPSRYLSHNPHFCISALKRYTQWDFINMVERHNVAYHEKHLGQLFCDNSAKDILNMLLKECEQHKVSIKLKCDINAVKKQADHDYLVNTSLGKFNCASLVIASGGLSIPTMGASPFGYKLAEQFGLKVWPTRAGLVPFTLHDKDKQYLQDLSGIALNCAVLCHNTEFKEDMLFTHRGLSGPAMLQISSYWQAGDKLTINLLPDVDVSAYLQAEPNKQLGNRLSQCLPKRVVKTFIADNLAQRVIKTLTPQELSAITTTLQSWIVQPNGTEGYRTAEVTLGGVDCDAISSKTMAVKTVPGLYFIGEVLDVSGWLGGYNFQWAWASGWAAGQVA